MEVLHRFFVCAAGACACAGAAFAQPPTLPAGAPFAAQSSVGQPSSPSAGTLPFPDEGGARVSLSVAVEAAWRRAVRAREVEGQRLRARAEQTAAASPWAAPPSLGLSYRDDRLSSGDGGRETEVGLSWPLWLPRQQAARAAAADAQLELAEGDALAARWQLAGEVRGVAWGLAALQAELAQATAQRESLQSLADDVDRRVRAGDLARADALAARAEATAALVLEEDATQRLQAQRARWFLLTGLQALPEVFDSAPTHEVADLRSHPESQRAARLTETARRRIASVEASRRDPPELWVRLISEVAGRGEQAQTGVGVAVRIPFGTEDRNRPLIAAALSELELAQAVERRTTDRLLADLQTARAAVESAQRQFAAERERARLLRERAGLIDKSFRAGETALPELLRAMAAAAQAEASQARQQAALGLARARQQQALGVMP